LGGLEKEWFMKNSRYSLLAVSVSILVCLTLLSAYAQDTRTNPYIGTWKLNVAKSDFGKLPASQIPKSETLVILPTDSETGRKFTVNGVGGDGKPFEMSFDGATDGKPHPSSSNDGSSIAFLTDGSWEMKDKSGSVVETGSATISDDGKVFTSTTVHKTPNGQITTTAVFDKVK
jgi:hypothetical protein